MDLTGNQAPKVRRFLADLIDLLIIPFLIGLVMGFVFAVIKIPPAISQIILVLINVAWLIVRDWLFSPGRALLGIKIISLTGSQVSPLQAVIRNIHLVVPFVLLAAYLCELIHVFVTSNLKIRRALYVLAGILVAWLMSSSRVLNPVVALVIGFLMPAFFLIQDKAGVGEGDRLMDMYSKTQVVKA